MGESPRIGHGLGPPLWLQWPLWAGSRREEPQSDCRLSSPPGCQDRHLAAAHAHTRSCAHSTHGPGTCLHGARCVVMLVCSPRLFLSLLLHGPHPGGYSLSCPSLSLVPSQSLAQVCELPTRPLGSPTSLERLQGVSKCRAGSCSSGCGTPPHPRAQPGRSLCQGLRGCSSQCPTCALCQFLSFGVHWPLCSRAGTVRRREREGLLGSPTCLSYILGQQAPGTEAWGPPGLSPESEFPDHG